MNVVEILNSYHQANNNLSLAIRAEDHNNIKQLDRHLVEVFDNVLSLEPNDNNEAREIVTLLLDELLPPNTRSNKDQRIIDKVIKMASHRS